MNNETKEYETIAVDDVLMAFSADAETGLTEEEAARRLSAYGANKLEGQKKRPLIIKFLLQFADIMILLLVAAAGVSLIFTFVNWHEEGAAGLVEPLVIFAIIIANAVIGLVQEGKAERALDALKSMSAPSAKVIRGDTEKYIPSADLVPGDIILLDAGDFVPADARLINSSSLKCEESALTGESVPGEKDYKAVVSASAPVGDRDNMVFAGTSVTFGTAKAVVCGTGMNTEVGKIASLLKGEKQSATPLQKKLSSLGKYLTVVALIACAAVFIIGLIKQQDWMELVMTSISLAVSAIPEALPAVVTVVLSIGVQRMAGRNAIIKKLPAVETLGSASIICSDKTGTLTQNKMTLISAFSSEGGKTEKISDNNCVEIQKLLIYGTLCSNGSVNISEDGETALTGDPTETSIIAAAMKNGFLKSKLNDEMPRLKEFPFDSDRKRMSTVNKIDGKYFVIVKGAVDEMLPVCDGCDRAKIKEITDRLSADALRVLGIAYKELPAPPTDELSVESAESGLTFMGLVGMIDPPREEAKQAVAECRSAGIKPIMITGDHIVTASAIAKQLGIMTDGDEAVTGAELEQMTDGELLSRLRNISVYARVSPSDKIRIVKAWQSLGEVVSMTGDGVNDAPALKAADIGCAMGITGTDVAKGAADMTLSDDNFSTIVHAVREGRGVYDNIKKVVGFLLGTNIGEIVLVLAAMIVWGVSPLISIQLLWINLVTDSLPAIMLGMEPIESGIMERKPRSKNEGLFANGYGVRIILQGFMFAGLAIGAYCIGLYMFGTTEAASTMAFFTLAVSQVLHAYNMRSLKPIIKSNPFVNKKLNIACLISLVLVCVVVFIQPIAAAFNMTIMPFYYYFIALGLAFVPIVVMDALKITKVIK